MKRIAYGVLFLMLIEFSFAQDSVTEAPPVTPQITVTEAGSTYQIKIECDTRYPDGTALDVQVSQIGADMEREVARTVFHRMLKVEQHRMGDTVSIPVEFFQPARYEIRISFSPDAQSEAMRNKVLNARVPLDPYTRTESVWIGSARDIQRQMTADMRVMDDVISRLDQLIDRLGKETGTPPDSKAAGRDILAINDLLKDGPTLIPKTRRGIRQFLLKLKTVANPNTFVSRYRTRDIPNEGLPENYERKYDELKGKDSGSFHLPPELSDTSGIRSQFAREGVWVVVNELDRLYQESDHVLDLRDSWKAFYARARREFDGLKKPLDDVRTSKTFADAFMKEFGGQDQKSPSELIAQLGVLLDRYDALLEHGASVKEIRENEQIVTQRQEFQNLRDALQKICREGR